MEINEFTKKVCGAVEKMLGREYKIEIREIRKNNGVIMHGMLILTQGQNVVPTIYLDSFWEAYEAGTPFAAIIRRLLSIYSQGTWRNSVNMEFFRFFEAVRDRICYRLVGKKGNEALLEDVPHIEFLDLAICFYYAYSNDTLGEGIILIHNSHMEMWETGTAELFRLAQQNTPELFPWECSTMEDILRELSGYETGRKASSSHHAAREIPMKVLSNVKKVNGAVCILYPGVLEKVAARKQRGFYIIPSSIHEVILLDDVKKSMVEDLRRIITEVNSTQIAPEEVLSDHLYYYDFYEKKIKIVS